MKKQESKLDYRKRNIYIYDFLKKILNNNDELIYKIFNDLEQCRRNALISKYKYYKGTSKIHILTSFTDYLYNEFTCKIWVLRYIYDLM